MLLVRFYKWSQRLHEQRNPGENFKLQQFWWYNTKQYEHELDKLIYILQLVQDMKIKGGNC